MRSGAKVLALLAALAMSGGVAACGSSDDGSKDSASSQGTATAESAPAWLTQAETAAAEATKIPDTVPSNDLGPFDPPKSKTIYHVACNLALEGCSKIANAIQSGTEALGYKFEKCDGGTTADKIGACFTNAVNAKPDAIVVNGIGVDAAGDGYAAAEKAGIPIIGTFTGNPEGAEGVKTEVAGDACTKEGKALADWIIADSKGKANALFVGTKTFTCNIQRQQSFLDEMKACETCKTDTLEFAIDAIQSGLPQQLQSALQTKPDLTYIVGTFDAVALAATDAIRQAGKSDAIKVAGFDADAPNLELIKKGDIQVADITTGSTEPGWAAADAAGRAIAGNDLPPTVSTSQLLITKDNIDQLDGGTYVGATGFEDQFKKLWEWAERLVLEVRNLSKTFVGQRALDGVDLDVHAAEVHALVGHNGSGKSTLIKLLSGFHQPDPGGSVEVAGTPLRPGDPAASRKAGLRFIHQELGLVDELTVLENLRLGGVYETGRGGRIRWRSERRRAREALARVGLNAHPDVPVSELSPVQRTQVAVARALDEEEGATILFFDEPTATLPHSEVERLFALIRRTVEAGLGVVYISHRLEELPQIADRVTVLRNGRVAGTGSQAEFTKDRLVELIVGGAVARAERTPRAMHRREGGLRFEDVHAGRLDGATFAVGPGEVVGMAGLAGSGVHDVARVLLGRIPLEAGSVLFDGEALMPDQRVRRGVAVLSSERALKNIPTMTVRENLTLPQLEPLWRGGRLRLREERAVARDLIRRFGVRPAEPEKPLMELSGGNQQKVAVAKWLRTKPRLMVLDEPTQGVDVGGKAEILELLRAAARDGVGVLICSSDLEDLEIVCDRVLVVREGRVGGELSGAQITRERVSEECYRDAA